MSFSIIISTHHRPVTPLRLLENLIPQAALIEEILLVEDGGYDWSSASWPAPLTNRIRVLSSARASAALSRDTGRRAARAEYLAFFDDDILLPPDYLANALQFFQDYPHAVACGGPYTDAVMQRRKSTPPLLGRLLGIYADGRSNRVLPSGWGDYTRTAALEAPAIAQWLFGCNAVYRRAVFEHPLVAAPVWMNGWAFLEDLFLTYSIFRAYPVGQYLVPALQVTHAPPNSSGVLNRTTLRMRIIHRYLFWRDMLEKKSRFSFWRGMLANLLLCLKEQPRVWVLREFIVACSVCVRYPDMTKEQANAFIFAPH